MFFSCLKRFFSPRKFSSPVSVPLENTQNISCGEDDNYRSIYFQLKKAMELEDVDITFHLGSDKAQTSMYYRNENGELIQRIAVYVPNYSQEAYYKATLIHELMHIKTSRALIESIGLTEYAKLVDSNSSSPQSLAFRTLAEYHSWYAEISKGNSSECTYSLSQCLYDYKHNSHAKKMDVCDNIAAHCAWYIAQNIYDIDPKLAESDKKFVQEIIQIIKDNAESWPLSLDTFDQIGQAMFQAFAAID